MGIDANPPPQSRMPEKLLNDDELQGYFSTLQEDLYRLWLRSGGGTDSTSVLIKKVAYLIQKDAGNESSIGKIRAINNDQDDLIEALIKLSRNNLQEIAGHSSDIGKQRAINNDQDDLIEALIKLATNNLQQIAGLVSNNGKLRATVNDLIDSTAFKKQVFTGAGDIHPDTNLVISDGTHTLVLPDKIGSVLDTKQLTGTTTYDPGSNTMEGATTSTATVARRLYLEGTVWLEL